MNLIPWLIHDAEVALWAAWKDGMPFHGPGEGRGRQEPLFTGKSSLTITETFEGSPASGQGWTGAQAPGGSTYQIALDFPDGALSDDFGRVLSRMHSGGFRILTVRFEDEATGEWTKLSFFYVTPATDALSEAGQLMNRAVSFKSSWKQEQVGLAAFPPLDPVVLGEVDWVCGPLRITALTYDAGTETWTSLARNEAGNGHRYVTLTPMAGGDGGDVLLAYYLPRLVPTSAVGIPSNALLAADGTPVLAADGDYIVTARATTELASLQVRWQNTLCLRVGNQASASHHGLTLQGGHTLQAAGIVEPLVMLSQDRMLDEPVLVFRYLRRIYATFGHGVFAVPALTQNETPPAVHDPSFRIAVPGAVNPETGNAGLVLLPEGAWIDGTLRTLG